MISPVSRRYDSEKMVPAEDCEACEGVSDRDPTASLERAF